MSKVLPPRPGNQGNSVNDRDYWENKQTVEFQRQASMSALKAAAMVLAACIESGTEKPDPESAIGNLIAFEGRIYNAVFKPMENGQNKQTERLMNKDVNDVPF